MAPTSQLFFNDAEWLESSGLRLVHPGIAQATAEALGVRSLRYHHEVDAKVAVTLPCPSLQQIQDRLLQASVELLTLESCTSHMLCGNHTTV